MTGRSSTRTSGGRPHSVRPNRLTGAIAAKSGNPSAARNSGRTATARTRPITTKLSPISTTWCSPHSIATGDSATRGGVTVSLGSAVNPISANSSTSDGNTADVAFTFSISSADARFTTNSPVASTFRRLSFLVTDVNCTIAGFTDATVKKLYGARFAVPSTERVDTHAIGRGTIDAVSSEYIRLAETSPAVKVVRIRTSCQPIVVVRETSDTLER